MSYNPKKEIFEVLKAADRPLSGVQVLQALKVKGLKIPEGTISSSLFSLREAKVVVSEKVDKTRAAVYRAVAKELPPELSGNGRLAGPIAHKARPKKKDAVLLMIPLPKGQSAVVSMEEARAIYNALAPLFQE